jgi:serine phosphatase RsbU (regulator of sigma subunit)
MLRTTQITASDLDEITLMSPGDIIFLYTDGVYDGDDEQDRQEIEQIFQEYNRKPARDICNAILDYALRNDEHLRQIGEPDRIDDKTVIIIKRE